MEFMDLTPQPEVQIPSVDAPTADVAEYHDVELNNFMSRPIRIANITWTYGSSINGTLNPWSLFFTDTRVKNRLAYYNLLKCNLCVKFVVNGNAFQYGQIFVDYLPLSNYTLNGTDVLVDGISPTVTTSAIYPNVQTHRSYIKIRPLDSQGACMNLPFYWPQNFMSIPLEEWNYMGNLRYRAVNPVLHANNAAATDPPIISVFAWAEDVKLSVPTAAPPATLLPQSGVEFIPSAGTEVVGAISGPATALSKFAGSLGSVPIIGRYAMATSMIASGIGAAAKMFGFSRPPIETPVSLIKVDPVGNIANTDRPEAINKFTVDSSQEVTVDPTVTGVSFGDELSIGSIATKETYLTQFTWDYTQGPDTALFYVRCNPLLHALVPGYVATRAIYPTAVEFASIPFRYWRGSLKFRFEVIGSKFHKGRLRMLYDPKQIPVVTDFNKNYQNVLDLDSSTDSTVVVHWAVPQPVLNCGTLSLSSVKYGAAFAAPTIGEDNGALYLYVLNNLSVPSQSLAAADCKVYVNVYVSACDDFELFTPDDVNLAAITYATPFTPSSGFEEELIPSAGSEMSENWEVGSSETSGDFNKVMFGEKYVSFRALLKRYVNYCNYWVAAKDVGFIARIVIAVRRIPLYPGSDSAGINSIPNLIGAVLNFPGNNIRNTPFQHLMGAYSGIRGSVRYKYQATTPSSNQRTNLLIQAVKKPSVVSSSTVTSIVAVGSANTDNLAAFTRDDYLWNGGVLYNTCMNPNLEVEDPYYDKYRFLNPKCYVNNTVGTSGGHTLTCYTADMNTEGTFLRSMIASGEDFNLMYYTGPGYLWTSAYY